MLATCNKFTSGQCMLPYSSPLLLDNIFEEKFCCLHMLAKLHLGHLRKLIALKDTANDFLIAAEML